MTFQKMLFGSVDTWGKSAMPFTSTLYFFIPKKLSKFNRPSNYPVVFVKNLTTKIRVLPRGTTQRARPPIKSSRLKLYLGSGTTTMSCDSSFFLCILVYFNLGELPSFVVSRSFFTSIFFVVFLSSSSFTVSSNRGCASEPLKSPDLLSR